MASKAESKSYRKGGNYSLAAPGSTFEMVVSNSLGHTVVCNIQNQGNTASRLIGNIAPAMQYGLFASSYVRSSLLR